MPEGEGVRSVRTQPQPAKESNTSNTLLAGVRDGAWLDRQDFPPLDWAVPGLIPSGFTLLAGPPKAGKSWLLLDLLLAVASGGVAAGRIPMDGAGRPVFYIALEDGARRMKARCAWLLDGTGEPVPPLFRFLFHVEPGQVMPTISAFIESVPETALVVIDTLGRVMPPAAMGESPYARDYRVGAALQGLTVARPGLSVVAVHHTRKMAAEDFTETISGTNGLAGAADTIMVLARPRHSTQGVLHVTGRDVDEAEYAMVTEKGRWILDGATLGLAAETARERKKAGELGGTMQEILAWAATRPEGFRAKDAVAQFGDAAYEYLKRLVANGHLLKAIRGFYTLPPK